MCPSTFDNFYIRRDVKILRQEYILPHLKEMEINAHAGNGSLLFSENSLGRKVTLWRR
jgi:hypothetical protein